MNINAPYYKAAIKELVTNHNFSEQDAQKAIETLPRNEIEELVVLHNKVYDAAKGLAKGLGLTDYESRKFADEMLGMPDKTIVQDELKARLQIVLSQDPTIIKAYVANLLLDACSEAHKSWIKHHANDFFGKHSIENEQYLHSPAELIGWKEMQKHLDIIEPIVNCLGLEVKQDILKEAYARRVVDFISQMQNEGKGIDGIGGPGIDTIIEIIDAVDNIENGNRGQLTESIASAWDHDPELITQIAHQVATKGIGSDQELIERLQESGILNRDDPVGLEYE